MSQLFYAMTMPGLETLAFSEIRAHIPDAEQVKFARGIALFRVPSEPETLLELRTVEDVFFTLAHLTGLRHGTEALRVIHSATLRSSLEDGLRVWRRAHAGARPRTWRVVSQMSGSYAFRRVDAGQTVISALRRVLPQQMRQVEDDADVEIWIWLGSSDVLIGLRLSDATMRHRSYKHEHLPASLRPTVAAAMAWLSRPSVEDIVLDPMCGAGTILIERALLSPLGRALGGDIQQEAVTLARRNVRSAEVSASLKVWDARKLPLESASVTRILTNLPFGKQISSHEENIGLYRALIGEFERVLSKNGLMVTLTSEDQLWTAIVSERGWRITRKNVLVVLGQPASIFVLERV